MVHLTENTVLLSQHSAPLKIVRRQSPPRVSKRRILKQICFDAPAGLGTITPGLLRRAYFPAMPLHGMIPATHRSCAIVGRPGPASRSAQEQNVDDSRYHVHSREMYL